MLFKARASYKLLKMFDSQFTSYSRIHIGHTLEKNDTAILDSAIVVEENNVKLSNFFIISVLDLRVLVFKLIVRVSQLLLLWANKTFKSQNRANTGNVKADKKRKQQKKR